MRFRKRIRINRAMQWDICTATRKCSKPHLWRPETNYKAKTEHWMTRSHVTTSKDVTVTRRKRITVSSKSLRCTMITSRMRSSHKESEIKDGVKRCFASCCSDNRIMISESSLARLCAMCSFSQKHSAEHGMAEQIIVCYSVVKFYFLSCNVMGCFHVHISLPYACLVSSRDDWIV